MTQVTKSVTRLLAERKTLEDRIRKATNTTFIGVQKGQEGRAEVQNFSGKTVEEMKTLFRSNKNKVDALISYHRRITAALIKSNAETTVTVNNETLTVAAAIERKASVAFDKTLLATIINQYAQTQQLINGGNLELERRIDVAVSNMLGADKSKVTAESRDNIAKPMEAVSKLSIIDPMDLNTWASQEMERISKFETEIDFILSEINARTEITIEDENVG